MIPNLCDRELKFSEIFKASWRILFSSFKYLCFFYVAVSIGLRLIYRLFSSIFPQVSEHRVVSYLSGTAYTVLMSFATLGAVFIVMCVLENKPISVAGIFYDLRRKALAGFIVGLLCQIPEILLWVPYFSIAPKGVFGKMWPAVVAVLVVIRVLVIVYFIFSLQTVAVRNKKGIEALRYSCRTVWGHWWKVFGKLLLFNLIFAVPIVILEIDLQAMKEIRIIVMPFIGAFLAVFLTILFLNIDREGLKEKVDELRHPVIPSENLL